MQAAAATIRIIMALGLLLALTLPADGDVIPHWLPKYDLDIHLDLNLKRVTVTERVTFTNRHARPANELILTAYPHFKLAEKDVPLLAKTLELLRTNPSAAMDFEGRRLNVQKITLGNTSQELPFHWREDMDTALVVPLPQPVQQGQSVTVEIAFTLDLPNKQGRWGHVDGITFLANWLPLLAYYDDNGWQPTPFIAWHQPFFHEAGVFSVRFICPANQKVACTGTIHETQDMGNGYKCVTIVGCPARDFALVCSERFQEWTDQADHVTIRVLAHPEHAAMAQKALAYACEVIPLYNKWFGPYPYNQFYIVEGRFPWNGNECAGLVMIDERVFSLTPMMDMYLDHLVSHEALHQWWYNVVGTNGFAETFMDESIACYYTARRLQKKYGPNAPLIQLPLAQAVMTNVHHEDYRFYGLYGTLARKEETKTVQDLDKFGNVVTLFSMTYDRGAKILNTIESQIGEQEFLNFMKLVYGKYQFRILRVADFQRELEEYTGRPWGEFFQNWLYSVGATDWAVESVKCTDEGGKCRTLVTLRQKAEFTEPTWLGIRFTKNGPYELRIPIVPGVGEASVDPPVQVETGLDGKTVRVSLLLPKEPVQISVDPDQILLDKEPTNNHWPVASIFTWRLTPLLTPLDETDLTTSYDHWNIIAGPWLGVNQPQFGQRPYAGFRAALYRLQHFQGGAYVAWDGEDEDLRVGFDARILHWPHYKMEVGIQYDHSLTPDWASLKRDRGRVYGRYIFLETSSLYQEPVHFIEGYGRLEHAFNRDPRFVPPGVENYDDFAAFGLRYYQNYLTPYWDPEGGFKIDLNYESGPPIVGNYREWYNRVQGEFALVKKMPDGFGYLSETRLAGRVFGGIGVPDNGWHFQLGGANRLRGLDRDAREGSAVWVATVEWRLPVWRNVDFDMCDHVCRMKHLYAVVYYDGGDIFLNGKSVGGGMAHSLGWGLRMDMAWMSFIERMMLRFDMAKVVNDSDQPMQFWFGLSHAF
jgi:hypothetical protein